MDIHTGGVDLKFPHHDNEIAQAEVSPIETFDIFYMISCFHKSCRASEIRFTVAHLVK